MIGNYPICQLYVVADLCARILSKQPKNSKRYALPLIEQLGTLGLVNTFGQRIATAKRRACKMSVTALSWTLE